MCTFQYRWPCFFVVRRHQNTLMSGGYHVDNICRACGDGNPWIPAPNPPWSMPWILCMTRESWCTLTRIEFHWSVLLWKVFLFDALLHDAVVHSRGTILAFAWKDGGSHRHCINSPSLYWLRYPDSFPQEVRGRTYNGQVRFVMPESLYRCAYWEWVWIQNLSLSRESNPKFLAVQSIFRCCIDVLHASF
jgi:hypothetical protein